MISKLHVDLYQTCPDSLQCASINKQHHLTAIHSFVNCTVISLCSPQTCSACSYIVDNHDSGYLGMAVQLHVQAHLGHYHILTQKEYSQKLMAQLKPTPLFTYICIIELLKTCRKHNTTTCKSTYFVLTD